MMRSDFCVLILSHGRANNVLTYSTLRKGGYTGCILVVVDNADKQLDLYREKYGDDVVVFDKVAAAKDADPCDNSGDLRSVLFARNASFGIARERGFRYFLQLDDDYIGFEYRFLPGPKYGYVMVRKTMDEWISAMLKFYESIPALSVATSQGGDYIGGDPGDITARRKCMNSFFCSTEREFQFNGLLNEDVTTYVMEGRRGHLFLTVMPIKLVQVQSQSASGGVTEMYLDSGTYRKAAYTVMAAPSCTKIGTLVDHSSPHPRIHHAIASTYAYPKILRQEHSK